MCCSSKKTGQEDRRRIIDHFMPPGAPLQPRYTYRLERIEEAEMEMIRQRCYAEAGALGDDSASEDGQTVTVKHSDDLLGEGDYAEDRVAAAREALTQTVGQVMLRRLGTFDCPLVGEDRFMLVETPIGTGASQYSTEETLVDEEEMVRQLQEEASDGRLFVSNTFGLVSFELSLRKPPPGAAPPLLLEPLASDAGVDFEEVLREARDKAAQGWRLRGALRGRPQVSDYVLSYALYADVVVTPFTHLVFSRDPAAHSNQVELVELRGTSQVVSGALVRIVKAWARRGWRLAVVLFNLVTTYDKVRADPPEGGAGEGPAELADVLFESESVGGEGALALYMHTAAFFERKMPPSEEGQMQAHLALEQRRQELAQQQQQQRQHPGASSSASESSTSAASNRPTLLRHPLD